MVSKPCVLCSEEGGEIIFSTDLYRVVWADEPLYPGFMRLIWNQHVKEFSELSQEHRYLCTDILVILERFALEHMGADKVNLATLGNVVPHLHWHVIPRFKDDPHFPAPVWAAIGQKASLASGQLEIDTQKPYFMDFLKRLLSCGN